MIRAIDNRYLHNTFEKHLALSCGQKSYRIVLVKMRTNVFTMNIIFFFF